MSQPVHPVTVPQQGQQQQRNLGQMIAGLGAPSPLINQSTVDPRSLAAGIKSSFATLTFKGKTWGIRHRGQTTQLLARDPATGAIVGAIPTVDVVIVKSAQAISKTYYIEQYKEGDFNQPDCWSTNGVMPDIAAPHKQNTTCRGCRWDAFGSRTIANPGGEPRKGKACSDNKRLAVVPASDLKNDAFGGPMLLKLAPSSFGGLAELEQELHTQGYAYFGIVMRLSFDHQVAYPRIVFTPIRVLNDYEMQAVIDLQRSDTVERILNEEVIEVTGDPGQPVPAQATSTPAVTTPPPAATPPPAQTASAFSPQPPPMQPPPMQPPPMQPQPIHTPPLALQSNDPGPPPAFLQRTGNGAQPPVQPTVQPPVQPLAQETIEQKVARLEAMLAAVTPAETKPARRTRRSGVVTPAGNAQGVVVTPPAPAVTKDPAQPFTAHAVQGEVIVPDGDQTDDEGDTPPDLDSRIDVLLNSGGKTT